MQGSKATISDPEFLKRLISDAKGTGWKGVMVALPYFIKAKTQMKLHPNEFTELILKNREPWTMVPFNGGTPF